MSPPLDEYKRLIDGIVKVTSSVAAARVRSGVWSPCPDADEQAFNELLKELSSEQKEIVARMLQDAATSAIHDVLAKLSEEEYQFTKDGIPVAIEPFGTELFYDYVCRLEGDEWPK